MLVQDIMEKLDINQNDMHLSITKILSVHFEKKKE